MHSHSFMHLFVGTLVLFGFFGTTVAESSDLVVHFNVSLPPHTFALIIWVISSHLIVLHMSCVICPTCRCCNNYSYLITMLQSNIGCCSLSHFPCSIIKVSETAAAGGGSKWRDWSSRAYKNIMGLSALINSHPQTHSGKRITST